MDDCSVLIRSTVTGQQVTLSTTADSPDELVTIESITTKRGTGFENAVLTLHRNPLERFDDVRLLMEVIITDGEGFVLHEGQITGLPPESGKVKIQSTGKWSILNDRAGFSQIYVDRDVSHWGGMPLERKPGLLTNNFKPADGQADAGKIRLQLDQPTWSANGKPYTSVMYMAPAGAFIGSLVADLDRSVNANTHWDKTNASFTLTMLLSDTAGLNDYDVTSDQAAAVPVTGLTLTATKSDRRFAHIDALYEAAFATDDSTERAILASNVKVYGNHGLSTITPSTVIRHLIDTYCPGLTYDDESIADHPYEIGQLVFDGVQPSMVVARVNSFANWNCEVWEGGKVWYQPQPILTEIDFILNTDDGDNLDPDGRTVTEDYPVNGVEVFYTDALTGLSERIGPDDDDRLTDTSDDNPCNREGRDRWGNMQLSEVANEDDAIQVGSVWLAEHLIPSRSGSGTARGTITTASGDEVPASRIRAGDVVRFKHESIGREVFETNYQPATGEVTLKFDDGVATLSAILERIGIRIQLLGGR